MSGIKRRVVGFEALVNEARESGYFKNEGAASSFGTFGLLIVERIAGVSVPATETKQRDWARLSSQSCCEVWHQRAL